VAYITFHVDPDTHDRMKKHPEIKWSEVFRRSIIEYLGELETSETMTTRELMSRLSDGARDIIKKLGENLDIEKEAGIIKQLHEVDAARLVDRWKSEKTEK
jgi:hypothetical protein